MVAAAVVGAAVIGGAVSASSSSKASKSQRAGADAATQAQWDMYEQTREDQAPWRDAGTAALSQIGTGMAAGGDFNRDFTMADFQKDPGYDFRLNQGLDSVQGSRAARGSMMSGATLKALSNYGSDYASSEYGKAYDRFNNDRTQRFNRLSSVAGIGQTATNNVGTAGANAVAGVTGNIIGAANATAAGQVATGNAINGGLSNLQSLYQLNQMNKNPYGAAGGSAYGGAGAYTGAGNTGSGIGNAGAGDYSAYYGG